MNMSKIVKEALTFDDVLLIPAAPQGFFFTEAKR